MTFCDIGYSTQENWDAMQIAEMDNFLQKLLNFLMR